MLFENIKEQLFDGMKVKAKLGRDGFVSVRWQPEKIYTLYVQKNKLIPVIIGIKEKSWAEYSTSSYEGNNLFLVENFYMQILEWFPK